jgi:hypothetical protein
MLSLVFPLSCTLSCFYLFFVWFCFCYVSCPLLPCPVYAFSHLILSCLILSCLVLMFVLVLWCCQKRLVSRASSDHERTHAVLKDAAKALTPIGRCSGILQKEGGEGDARKRNKRRGKGRQRKGREDKGKYNKGREGKGRQMNTSQRKERARQRKTRHFHSGSL